jgi:hypothetical protein
MASLVYLDLGQYCQTIAVHGKMRDKTYSISRLVTSSLGAVVPGRVVPDVRIDHALGPLQLLRVGEQVEALDQPLPVAPDVVVLLVPLEHLADKVGLSLGRTERIDDGLAVVPDLVVLEVLEGGRVEPLDLVFQRRAELGYCLCAV